MAESDSAWMSKIANDGLTWSGCYHMATVGVKGLMNSGTIGGRQVSTAAEAITFKPLKPASLREHSL